MKIICLFISFVSAIAFAKNFVAPPITSEMIVLKKKFDSANDQLDVHKLENTQNAGLSCVGVVLDSDYKYESDYIYLNSLKWLPLINGRLNLTILKTTYKLIKKPAEPGTPGNGPLFPGKPAVPAEYSEPVTFFATSAASWGTRSVVNNLPMILFTLNENLSDKLYEGSFTLVTENNKSLITNNKLGESIEFRKGNDFIYFKVTAKTPIYTIALVRSKDSEFDPTILLGRTQIVPYETFGYCY